MIPSCLSVVVGVNVDPARTHNVAIGVDFVATSTDCGTNFDDPAVVDGNIGTEPAGAGAVDYFTVANNYVVHCFPDRLYEA